MKLLKRHTFYILFALLIGIETIIANLEGLQNVHYISKPLIVGALLFYFISKSKHLSFNIRKLTVLALGFSLIGDILLLFVFKSKAFFITGLLAFLIAHVMYSLLFFKQRNKSKKPQICIVLLVVYALILFWFLKSGLNDLLIPVILYMLVLLTMATLAFLRQGRANTVSYNLVLIGALIFIISDSLLAINKFYTPVPLSSFSIMFTYALAQLLITTGILKGLKN
ncbi:lysoplasmalogenase [Lacinutrix neustonica]|uniref:Lysoplasmalogenase n=1 Tax=Lacinutrix neustonica TaxID=2980107 RepID=A0A9E8MX74_9FLAO|nr:lysoplasmalogenase [Lacinutrix neustonica]WAC03218.1 lysoplasmalogenase [Lacinutrix neustonica]